MPQHAWQDRRRLKGHLTVDTGVGKAPPGELAEGGSERYLPNVRLFTWGVATTLGMRREAGHAEPGIIVMACQPTKATVLDDGARWAIEPTFSDFKSRGFQVADTPLPAPDRLERLILIMTLAMEGCGRIGQAEALYHPTV